MQTHDRSDEIVSPSSDPMTNSQQAAQLPEPPPPKPLWWLVLLRYCQRNGVTLAICSSGIFVIPVAAHFLPPLASTPQASDPQQRVFTRLDCELLKLGMTITDAQAAIGQAIEASRDETTVTYRWTNGDGAEITAVFKGGRLINKQQRGLN